MVDWTAMQQRVPELVNVVHAACGGRGLSPRAPALLYFYFPIQAGQIRDSHKFSASRAVSGPIFSLCAGATVLVRWPCRPAPESILRYNVSAGSLWDPLDIFRFRCKYL